MNFINMNIAFERFPAIWRCIRNIVVKFKTAVIGEVIGFFIRFLGLSFLFFTIP